MKLQSSAFSPGGSIPSKYTCDGSNISPPLNISDVPQGAKSLVLILDDHDVPASLRADQTWDHWVVFNLSPETTTIEENAAPSGTCGLNTSGKPAYEGPCPPDKEHRYVFRLFALDCELDLTTKSSKKQVEQAMEGHVLESTELMGRYARN